jgi:hypothetical protein
MSRILRRARRRVLALPGREECDEGVALISVMLITMLIVSLIGVVVAATATNLQGSGLDRKRTQTSAAAEAGVDAVLANLQTSAGTAVPCSATGSISGATYTTKVAYYATYPPSGTPLTCSNGTLSGSPAAALVTSTGSGPAAYNGAGTTFGDRTMTALVRLTGGSGTGPVLDKAVFTDASVSLTNAWKLTSVNGSDASFYTNGNFSCNSTPTINGSVYAQGTASLTNSCWIDGDMWANGTVSTSSTGTHVGGMIKSSTGNLSEGNSGIYIGKGVQVAGKCCGGKSSPLASDGKPQTVASGTIQTGVTTLGPPPSESFPRITYDPSQWPGYGVQTWADWMKTNATANGAPSWSDAYNGSCTAAAASYSLNGPLTSPGTPTIIDARSCGLSWNAVSIKLNSDLIIFTNSLTSSNGVNVTSADGKLHTLRLIVPWPAGATSCSTANAGTLTFNSGGTAIGSNVQMLLYSAGNVSLTNNIDFYGQIYGCSLTASVNVTVRYVPVGAGGGGGGTPTPYKVDVAYLRDS